ncbi:POLY(A) BINDING PROTEIN 8 [Ceraceosorus bombacis]|uniref:POLY(A) BINDING PROTEIN 8 n=1 Tax=Ceraceosorus bombacis TaxID=401625 RepID=A0A0P1BDR3_9BASI|nr:POLY(A) BINDING PROTEIN 8 [Ceraceosorus bombacis]
MPCYNRLVQVHAFGNRRARRDGEAARNLDFARMDSLPKTDQVCLGNNKAYFHLVYVRGPHHVMHEATLRGWFSSIGAVVARRFPRSSREHRYLAYCFVTFANAEQAQRAIARYLQSEMWGGGRLNAEPDRSDRKALELSQRILDGAEQDVDRAVFEQHRGYIFQAKVEAVEAEAVTIAIEARNLLTSYPKIARLVVTITKRGDKSFRRSVLREDLLQEPCSLTVPLDGQQNEIINVIVEPRYYGAQSGVEVSPLPPLIGFVLHIRGGLVRTARSRRLPELKPPTNRDLSAVSFREERNYAPVELAERTSPSQSISQRLAAAIPGSAETSVSLVDRISDAALPGSADTRVLLVDSISEKRAREPESRHSDEGWCSQKPEVGERCIEREDADSREGDSARKRMRRLPVEDAPSPHGYRRSAIVEEKSDPSKEPGLAPSSPYSRAYEPPSPPFVAKMHSRNTSELRSAGPLNPQKTLIDKEALQAENERLREEIAVVRLKREHEGLLLQLEEERELAKIANSPTKSQTIPTPLSTLKRRSHSR